MKGAAKKELTFPETYRGGVRLVPWLRPPFGTDSVTLPTHFEADFIVFLHPFVLHREVPAAPRFDDRSATACDAAINVITEVT